MKPAISLYSFNSYIRQSGASLTDCIDKAAGFGFEGLDIIPNGSGDFNKDIELAKTLGGHIKATGLNAVCYCCGGDFVNAFNGDIQKETDRLKKEVEIAAAYGCSLMRHDATSGYPKNIKTKRGFDDALPRLVEGYTAVTEFAQSAGIKTCIENHGFFIQDSDRVEKIINSVGHINFGALLDIGNFCCADEDNCKATAILAPYAFHAHVKDFHIKSGKEEFPGDGWFRSRGGNYLRGSILGHGNVSVEQCVSILHTAGYDGYLCLEFEGLEDALLAAKLSILKMKRIIGKFQTV